MIKVILIYILIITISFLVSLSIRLNWDKNSLTEGTTCEGGVCSPPKEYKDGRNR